MKMVFYVVRARRWYSEECLNDLAQARLVGSPYHVLVAHSAALAFVYVALAPLSRLAAHGRSTSVSKDDDDPHAWPIDALPVRFGARCDRLGRPYVGAEVFDPDEAAARSSTPQLGDTWWWDGQLAAESVERCDRAREKFLRVRGLI